jgi:coenzyme F420-reducing hydrogenase alpha subunit
MRDAEAYPIHHGQIMASDGLMIDASQFDRHFTESQVEHSTALYSSYQDKPYLVGPLARLNLNRDRLPDAIQQLMYDTGMTRPSSNMFNSMLARAIELHYAISEAVRLLHGYAHTQKPAVAVTPREGVGHGCSEAPRGLLWHRYEVDGEGRIVAARIVPPTSQNQARIEEDLRLSLQDFGLHHDDDALRLHCEKVIRNYDPCISCATHFLKLRVERL